MNVIDGIDYGPLGLLVGTWRGDKGMDVSPQPDGSSETPYDETIVCEAGGNVTNAGSQALTIVRYHQSVRAKASVADPDWGIVQSPFMRDNARTAAFSYEGTIDGDAFRYHQTTSLEIYGRSFEHTDGNELRCADG